MDVGSDGSSSGNNNNNNKRKHKLFLKTAEEQLPDDLSTIASGKGGNGGDGRGDSDGRVSARHEVSSINDRIFDDDREKQDFELRKHEMDRARAPSRKHADRVKECTGPCGGV